MVAGANGTNGVCAQRQSAAYKQGQENARSQSQRRVENPAMEPE